MTNTDNASTAENQDTNQYKLKLYLLTSPGVVIIDAFVVCKLMNCPPIGIKT